MRQNLLSDQSVSVLRKLLGIKVYTIFAPNLDAAGAHLAASKLSMLIKKDHFVNFSCEWSETPRYLNDSWLIEVAESSNPIGIQQDDSGALIAPCTIKMYRAQPIIEIQIYNYCYVPEKEGPEESVQYDQAILFRCAEERAFCIGCLLNGPGIANDLHFSEDAGAIQEMIDSSTVRLVLE
jgi:hypothetical protein